REAPDNTQSDERVVPSALGNQQSRLSCTSSLFASYRLRAGLVRQDFEARFGEDASQFSPGPAAMGSHDGVRRVDLGVPSCPDGDDGRLGRGIAAIELDEPLLRL